MQVHVCIFQFHSLTRSVSSGLFPALHPPNNARTGTHRNGEVGKLRGWATSSDGNSRTRELAAGFKFGQDLLGDFFQRFEYAYALEGDSFDHGFVLAA